MDQGGSHFRKDNDVFKSLRRIVRRLDDLGLPYAVVGGLALFEHGFERFTVDVNLLVTPETLKRSTSDWKVWATSRRSPGASN